MRTLVLLLLALPLWPPTASAQQIAGDWVGLLQAGPAQLELVLHITGDAAAGYRATFDSPDQNVMGLEVGEIALEGTSLTFTLPQVGGTYQGTVHESGTTIAGLWSQGGNALPLELTRRNPGEAPPPRVPRPGELDGTWNGTVNVQGQMLDVAVHIVTYEDGLGGTLDVPAQNARGLPITLLTRTGDSIRLEMRIFAATYDGTLDAGRTAITGTWRQPGFESGLALRKAAAGN